MAIQIIINSVDKTSYLQYGEGRGTTNASGDASIRFQGTFGQRGTANIPLRIPDGDSYVTAAGVPVIINEIVSSVTTAVWSGVVQAVSEQYEFDKNDHMEVLICVSMESVFDALRISPRAYINKTCGFIVNDLFSAVCGGVPITLGTIDDGPYVTSTVYDNDTVADAFTSLANIAGFQWWIDPNTQKLMFTAPTAAAPFTLHSTDVLISSSDLNTTLQDYRNRQLVDCDDSLFGPSECVFAIVSTSYQLGVPYSGGMRPLLPKGISAVYAVKIALRGGVNGTFSGQPSPGDTITIGNPSGISPWRASHLYGVGNQVIDSNNHVQQATNGPFNSGVAHPIWNQTGGTTAESTGLIWRDMGFLSNFVTGSYTYVFVSAIDNTQFGQVLIGASVGDTGDNLVGAINADPFIAGIGYSLATWEHFMCNASAFDHGTNKLSIYVKDPGGDTSNHVSPVSADCPNFTWATSTTTAGIANTSQQLTVSPAGGDGTSDIQWNPDSTIINLNRGGSSLSAILGWFLVVKYTRLGGSTITVENTSQVATMAGISGGTGKYQAKTQLSGLSSVWAGLQKAQGLLSAYGTLPVKFQFVTNTPLLRPGMILPISMTDPTGLAADVNGSLIVQEVRAEMVNKGATDEHFQYTIGAVNITIANYVQFWLDLKGGGGGGGISSGGLTLGSTTANGGYSIVLVYKFTVNTSGDLPISVAAPIQEGALLLTEITNAGGLPITWGTMFGNPPDLGADVGMVSRVMFYGLDGIWKSLGIAIHP